MRWCRPLLVAPKRGCSVFRCPMIGGALLAAGATTAAVVVLSAAVMVAIVGGVRTWRTRP
jgi:hypothetical protein